MASGDGNSQSNLDNYINDLKSSISLWEDMTLKSQKLNSNFKITGQSFNSLIEVLSSVSKTGNTHFSGLDQIENLLCNLGIREKYIADKIQILNNAVQNHLVVNLSSHIENWRKAIINVKKERDIDCRKAKIDYKKAVIDLAKLENKVNKRQTNNRSVLSDTMSLQIDYAAQNLMNKKRFIEEMERCSLKKAVSEERNRFKQFLICLRPILDAQLSMKTDLEELQQIYDKLYSSNAEDLSSIPADVESYVKQYQVLDCSRVSSLSSLYSRVNSQMSLSSSYCSSLENQSHLQTLNSMPLESTENKLETSSSTIQDLNISFPPPPPQSDTNHALSDEDSSSSEDLNVKNSTFHTAQESLYPNQVMPPPRYSNLRELKQTADKKYGTCAVRIKSDHASRQVALSKRSSLNIESDLRSLNKHLASLSHHPCKDNESYSAVYDTASMFADVGSGTSTFKRRKPSLIAMETPTIMDPSVFQHFEQSTLNKKNQRSLSEDRINSEISQACPHVESISLGQRYVVPKNNRMVNCCSNMILNDMTRPPNIDNITNPALNPINHNQQQLPDGSTYARHHSFATTESEFKQQLMKVIQGSRPSFKSVSPISSHMF